MHLPACAAHRPVRQGIARHGCRWRAECLCRSRCRNPEPTRARPPSARHPRRGHRAVPGPVQAELLSGDTGPLDEPTLIYIRMDSVDFEFAWGANTVGRACLNRSETARAEGAANPPGAAVDRRARNNAPPAARHRSHHAF